MRGVTRERGFSLLEVLVALAILGLGLTSILSAQAGLFSSSARSMYTTTASNLARCKIAELEVKLLREGYQWTEQKGEGTCCEDETESTYSCKWNVEPVRRTCSRAFRKFSIRDVGQRFWFWFSNGHGWVGHDGVVACLSNAQTHA